MPLATSNTNFQDFADAKIREGAEIKRLQDAANAAQPVSFHTKSQGASAQESLSTLLEIAPQLADAEYEALLKFLPQQVRLATDLAREFGPQQAQINLDIANQFSPQFAELFRNLQSGDRDADIADVTRLAPQLQDIRKAAEDPAVTALRERLIGDLTGELNAGVGLTAEEERSVVQGLRESEIARGLGLGRGSANREAVSRAVGGVAKRDRTQAKVAQLLRDEVTSAPDPFLAILSRPSTAATAGFNRAQGTTQLPTQAGSNINPLPAAFSVLQAGNLERNFQLGLQQLTQSSQLAANAAQEYGIFV